MRTRATVICIKDCKFLVVQERGQNHLSLPGGGVKKGEQSIVAAIREFQEETGLRTASIEHLVNFQGNRGSHRVFVVNPRPGGIKRLQLRLTLATSRLLPNRLAANSATNV